MAFLRLITVTSIEELLFFYVSRFNSFNLFFICRFYCAQRVSNFFSRGIILVFLCLSVSLLALPYETRDSLSLCQPFSLSAFLSVSLSLCLSVSLSLCLSVSLSLSLPYVNPNAIQNWWTNARIPRFCFSLRCNFDFQPTRFRSYLHDCFIVNEIEFEN